MKEIILRDNDSRFLEIIMQSIRKIDPEALFIVKQYLKQIKIEIQSKEECRSKIFNKLYNLHSAFGLMFKPSQFIKKDKNIIYFDLESE